MFCYVLTDKCCAIYLKFFGVEIIMALAPHPSPRHKEKKKTKRKSTSKQQYGNNSYMTPKEKY
jgi:hypothetical protein